MRKWITTCNTVVGKPRVELGESGEERNEFGNYELIN
jgi:hypothetical protein